MNEIRFVNKQFKRYVLIKHYRVYVITGSVLYEYTTVYCVMKSNLVDFELLSKIF